MDNDPDYILDEAPTAAQQIAALVKQAREDAIIEKAVNDSESENFVKRGLKIKLIQHRTAHD